MELLIQVEICMGRHSQPPRPGAAVRMAGGGVDGTLPSGLLPRSRQGAPPHRTARPRGAGPGRDGGRGLLVRGFVEPAGADSEVSGVSAPGRVFIPRRCSAGAGRGGELR